MIAVMHLALKHFSQKTALNHCVIWLFSIEVKKLRRYCAVFDLGCVTMCHDYFVEL